MKTAQRVAVLVGGAIVLVALVVAVVAPVSAEGYGCGSALLADDADHVLSRRVVTLGDGSVELRRQQRELEALSIAIRDECATARRSRLLLAGIGVVAGGAVVAGGGAMLRDRE